MEIAFNESRDKARTFAEVRAAAAAEGIALGVVPRLLLAVSLGAVAWSAVHPSGTVGGGVVIDRVTAAAALLVATVGTVCFGYAVRCLEGHPRRVRFLRAMAFTVVAAWVLAIADAFPVVLAAWIGVGLGVDRLLRFCDERPRAVAVARRKFVASRLGDALLVAAALVAWLAWDATGITAAASAASASSGPALTAFVLLVAAAALIKCAQAPLHGWLPETMDAPTPVSALMHAGIVNAGGVLLVRLAPAMARVPEAWILLSVVGTASILIAAPAAWSQARAKTSLAWSTVSQMGFMVVQCGLCVFPAALLHVVGHGAYKAWAFLRAGEVPPPSRAEAPSFARALVMLSVGTALAVPALAFGVWAMALDVESAPGKLALLSVVALAVGQAWVALLGTPRRDKRAAARRIAAAMLASVVIPAVACLMYAGAAAWVLPALPAVPPVTGSAAWIASVVPVLGITALCVMHAWAFKCRRAGEPSSLLIHAMNGFYVGIVVGRALDRIHALVRSAILGDHRA